MKPLHVESCAPLLGDSGAAQLLRTQVAAFAEVDTPVLLEGERGTGREHLARLLHICSRRRQAAFIRIDAEFADTERAAEKLRRAHGGSVLLKDLPHGTLRLRKLLMQWLDKNLALLTSGEESMPLRVFATTDVELPRLIEAGLVAPELLQKLGVLRLSVPPLRERSADTPRLCEHFLSELSIQSGAPIRTLAPRALDQVMRYSWPGNLAELRDVMRRAALRAREPAIQLADVEMVLPPLHQRVPIEELSLAETVRTKLRALLQRYLSDQGYSVRTVDGAGPLDVLLQRERFDVLVLDVMMPGEDGLAICRRLRAQGETIPILMLTARGDPVDRIVGLEMGADDYLPKPFEPRELVARLQTVLRRRQPQSSSPAPLAPAKQDGRLLFEGLTVDATTRSVWCMGQPLELTSTEFDLLHLLAREPGKVFHRDDILNQLRGHDADLYTRAVDIVVSRLRKKLEPLDAIKTLRNAGYALALRASSPGAPHG